VARRFAIHGYLCRGSLLPPPAFPTRRSSDLPFFFHGGIHAAQCAARRPSRTNAKRLAVRALLEAGRAARRMLGMDRPTEPRRPRDRKSTRLNSSHVKSSYAVFCLKKQIRAIP